VCSKGPGVEPGPLNQTRRNTPLLETLSDKVTILDPTHPLYGQTLPRLAGRVNRSTPHVMVLLPTGRRHAVPRSATNLECPTEAASYDHPLPAISVRTILPLARFVQQPGAWQRRKAMRSRQLQTSYFQKRVPPFRSPSGISFQQPANGNGLTWLPNSFSTSVPPPKTRSVTHERRDGVCRRHDRAAGQNGLCLHPTILPHASHPSCGEYRSPILVSETASPWLEPQPLLS